MIRRLVWSVICFLGSLNSPNSVRASDGVLTKRVQEEYPKALKKLEARYSMINGQAIETRYNFAPPGAEKKSITNYDFAFNESMGRVVATAGGDWVEPKDKSKALYRTVSCYNEKYSFSLNTREPGADPTLRSLDDDSSAGRKNCFSVLGNKLLCASRPDEMDLSSWFEHSLVNIDLVSEEPSTTDPRGLLIQFTITPLDRKTKKPGDQKDFGWLLVSPDEGWVLRDYGVSASRKGKVSKTGIGHIDYIRSSDGYLNPIRHTNRIYAGLADRKAPGSPTRGYDLDIKPLHFDQTPDSAFSLVAFGLPEVGQAVNAPPAVRWLWVIVPASLVLASAIGLKYVARRWHRSGSAEVVT